MKDSRNMNPHERLYRRTGKWLLVSLGLWILAIVAVMFAPPGIGIGIEDSDLRYIAVECIVMLLFAAIFVLGVIPIVAYIRWTGKYPYYFLFPKSRERVRRLRKDREAAKKLG